MCRAFSWQPRQVCVGVQVVVVERPSGPAGVPTTSSPPLPSHSRRTAPCLERTPACRSICITPQPVGTPPNEGRRPFTCTPQLPQNCLLLLLLRLFAAPTPLEEGPAGTAAGLPTGGSSLWRSPPHHRSLRGYWREVRNMLLLGWNAAEHIPRQQKPRRVVCHRRRTADSCCGAPSLSDSVSESDA